MFINKYVTINKHLIARPCSCKITQKQRNMPKIKQDLSPFSHLLLHT